MNENKRQREIPLLDLSNRDNARSLHILFGGVCFAAKLLLLMLLCVCAWVGLCFANIYHIQWAMVILLLVVDEMQTK